MYRPLFLPKFSPKTDLSLSRTGAFCRTSACVMCKFSCVLPRVDTAHLSAKYGMPTDIFHCTYCPSISGHKKALPRLSIEGALASYNLNQIKA